MSRLSLMILALLAAAFLSPFETQAISGIPNFTHPESLPDQASDNARDALEARGSHGTGNGDGDGNGDDEAVVDNHHGVIAGESVMVEHHLTNAVVSLNVTISVTPGGGVEIDMNLNVNAPGNDKELPAGPSGDVPMGPSIDLPRVRG